MAKARTLNWLWDEMPYAMKCVTQGALADVQDVSLLRPSRVANHRNSPVRKVRLRSW